jgi:hypothetical protein
MPRNHLDAQFTHRAPELCLRPNIRKFFFPRGFAGTDIDAVAVGIQSGRQPVLAHIAIEDIVGGGRVLGRVETRQRPVGRIVDHYHQYRPLPTPLEPVVFRAVDLH